MFCVQGGQFKKDCPKRKKNQGQKESGDVVATGGCESSEVLCVAKDKTSQEWVFDSGCSYNICPHKNWFISYNLGMGFKCYMAIIKHAT